LKPILQVALDLTDLFQAIDIALKIVYENGCSDLWLEAGTPLIKSWGRIAVKTLKDITKCFIVADSKTMDTGDVEAEIYLKAGADAVTVLGLADDETIKGALSKVREYNGKLIVDLINHPKPYERALTLDKLNVDVILYHIGIDVQLKRGLKITDLISEVNSLKRNVSSMIAVAGGIKLEDLDKILEADVDIVIVGGAIIKSSNPAEATRMFIERIKALKTR